MTVSLACMLADVSLWKERNGFEIVLFGIGIVLTVALFIFFVRLFHSEREEPPHGEA